MMGLSNLNQQFSDYKSLTSYIIKMDEAQMREVLEQKQQNPRLKRIPLNLGNKFINFSKPGTQLELENPFASYPILLLLFGSEWCNITKPFVKLVKKHYEQINLEKKNIEIIYISLDKSKKDFDTFVSSMPWLGISFDDPRVKDLKQFYNARSIPYLILVDNKGQQIYNGCREDIYYLKEDDAFQKWMKLKQVALLSPTEQQVKQT